ncbi:MAG TPA: histidine phosphatase family protein [Alphaproteobacteria bacterium]|nr:histidine phosphatase family protein [Alphaproteobacteria bacterium]
MITRRGFWFLRHGQTDWNGSGRWQGRTDVPLNALGEQQARAAGPMLRDAGIELICTSPLQRARRTAELVAEALNLPVVAVAGLEEFDVGPYEGRTEGHWLAPWHADAEVPGVESFPAFRQRVAAAVNGALGHPGEVLVVAHGGVFWALERLCGAPGLSRLANCAPVRLDPSGEAAWRIEKSIDS